MRDKLRRRYQVNREVTRNGYFEGEIALAELTRLDEMLYRQPGDQDGGVAVRFEFVRNEFGTMMLIGQLQASLELQCQRCLQPLTVEVEQDIELMIDAGVEEVRGSSLDAIDSDEGYIDIIEVVEDELILALPLVALHEDTACNEHWPVADVNDDAGDKDNPFAVLRQLKATD